MITGLRLFLQDRGLITLDERQYLQNQLKSPGSRWNALWARCPRLHFCMHYSGDTEIQKKFLGATVDELKNSHARFESGKPTVIVLTHDVTRTGAPKIILEIVHHLRRSHNVLFMSLCGGDLRDDFVEAANCSFFNLGFSELREKIRYLVGRTGIRPTLILTNSIGSAAALPALAELGAPIVQLIHEIADIESPSRFEAVARYCAAIVFPAPMVRERALACCKSLDAAKTYTVPQGVFLGKASANTVCNHAGDALRPADLDPGMTVVFGAGSVDFRKGVDLFVMSAQRAFERSPGAKLRFVWAGNGFDERGGGYSAYLQRQIECAGLGGKMVFAGEIKGMAEAYRNADIFLLSSRFDPLPLVAQDAMAARVPVVCFDGAGGIPEFLNRDPDAAFGVVPYLDITAAADKILRLAYDETLRARVGDGNLRVAERYFRKEDYFRTLDEVCAKVMSSEARVYSEELSTLF